MARHRPSGRAHARRTSYLTAAGPAFNPVGMVRSTRPLLLLAAALALACVTAKTATVSSKPPESPPAPATSVPPPAVAEAPPATAAATAPPPRCAPAGMELVTKGQTVQREKGEDGAEEAIALYRQALAGEAGCAEALWELGW